VQASPKIQQRLQTLNDGHEKCAKQHVWSCYIELTAHLVTKAFLKRFKEKIGRVFTDNKENTRSIPFSLFFRPF
jgi:hypothetical protein